MPSFFTNVNAFQTVFQSVLLQFMCIEDMQSMRRTCVCWKTWIVMSAHMAPPLVMRPLTREEVTNVINQLKELRLPWSDATETYVNRALTQHPAVPENREDWQEPLLRTLTILYSRAVLSPKTNIGTLSFDVPFLVARQR
jgi:hypothetical protein